MQQTKAMSHVIYWGGEGKYKYPDPATTRIQPGTRMPAKFTTRPNSNFQAFMKKN